MASYTSFESRYNNLPYVLAGPILRRVEKNRICVWVACKSGGTFKIHLYQEDEDHQGSTMYISENSADLRKIGDNLFIGLIDYTIPNGVSLSESKIYSYDLKFTFSNGDTGFLAEPGVVTNTGGESAIQRLCYGDFIRPTFIIPKKEIHKLNVMHASCRKPHGGGVDSFRAADKILRINKDNVKDRPQMLFLTGDQIYADDVSPVMLALIDDIQKKIINWHEPFPIEFMLATEQNDKYKFNQSVEDPSIIENSNGSNTYPNETSRITETAKRRSFNSVRYFDFNSAYQNILTSDSSSNTHNLQKFKLIELNGITESMSDRDLYHVSILPGARAYLINYLANFSVDSKVAHSHLLTFAEYSVMYLLSFSDVLWPEESTPLENYGLPDDNEVFKNLDLLRFHLGGEKGPSPSAVIKMKAECAEHRIALDSFRRSLVQIRRAMANVSTYMMLDDHDVTDDFLLNLEWCHNTVSRGKPEVGFYKGSKTARRIITNGLSAFTVFQAWGNVPERYGAIIDSIEKIASYDHSWLSINSDNTEIGSIDLTKLKKIRSQFEFLEHMLVPDYSYAGFASEGMNVNQASDEPNPDGSYPLKGISIWHLRSFVYPIYRADWIDFNSTEETSWPPYPGGIYFFFNIDFEEWTLIFLDTRNCRGYFMETTSHSYHVDPNTGNGVNLHLYYGLDEARREAPQMISDFYLSYQIPLGTEEKKMAVLISASPVFGHSTLEYGIDSILGTNSKLSIGLIDNGKLIEEQKPLVDFTKEAIDYEAWGYGKKAQQDLLERLNSYCRILILSGDVHYSFGSKTDYWNRRLIDNPKQSVFVQFVASSLKNQTRQTLAMEKMRAFDSDTFGWQDVNLQNIEVWGFTSNDLIDYLNNLLESINSSENGLTSFFQNTDFENLDDLLFKKQVITSRNLNYPTFTRLFDLDFSVDRIWHEGKSYVSYNLDGWIRGDSLNFIDTKEAVENAIQLYRGLSWLWENRIFLRDNAVQLFDKLQDIYDNWEACILPFYSHWNNGLKYISSDLLADWPVTNGSDFELDLNAWVTKKINTIMEFYGHLYDYRSLHHIEPDTDVWQEFKSYLSSTTNFYQSTQEDRHWITQSVDFLWPEGLDFICLEYVLRKWKYLVPTLDFIYENKENIQEAMSLLTSNDGTIHNYSLRVDSVKKSTESNLFFISSFHSLNSDSVTIPPNWIYRTKFISDKRTGLKMFNKALNESLPNLNLIPFVDAVQSHYLLYIRNYFNAIRSMYRTRSSYPIEVKQIWDALDEFSRSSTLPYRSLIGGDPQNDSFIRLVDSYAFRSSYLDQTSADYVINNASLRNDLKAAHITDNPNFAEVLSNAVKYGNDGLAEGQEMDNFLKTNLDLILNGSYQMPDKISRNVIGRNVLGQVKMKKDDGLLDGYKVSQYCWFEPEKEEIEFLGFLNGPLDTQEQNDGWIIPLLILTADFNVPLENTHPYATNYE